MKALIFDTFGGEIRHEAVQDPSCPEGSVVVAVRATGLCRSDWHGWQGHDPDIGLPHVPGHEFAGDIVEVGSGVKRWSQGDRVTVPFVCGCGHCEQCASGNQQVCENQSQPGFTHWGSFAEYVRIDYADTNVVALPEEMDYITAASLGCRLVTSFRALVDQAQVRPGEWVAIHGCGGVGLSAIMIARAIGARVIAVDIRGDKLERARAAGAEVTLLAPGGAPQDQGNPMPGSAPSAEGKAMPGAVGNTGLVAQPAPSIVEQIHDITGGGVHVSLDALGTIATCVQSVESLRTRGRHIQVGLTLGAHRTPPIPMDRVIAKELRLIGSHGIQAHRYPAIFAMIAAGTLRPGELVGELITLEAAAAELMQMDAFPGTGIKVVDRLEERAPARLSTWRGRGEGAARL